MKSIICVGTLLAFSLSCNWVKERSKDTIHGTGEIVGKAGAEFTHGVAKGVEKTFSNQFVVADPLTKAGLATGKIVVGSGDSAEYNIVSAYLIFNNSIDRDITAKVFTEDGKEYGRVTQHVKGALGEARFVDFVFDKRTDIDFKGKITIE